MPNIEIHGLKDKEASVVAKKIWKLFKKEPEADKILITICRDRVINCKGVCQPYLKIIADNFARHILEKITSAGIWQHDLVIEYIKPGLEEKIVSNKTRRRYLSEYIDDN
ncbi:hypothetical protein J7K24_01490 [bacterium]|nr:hypothetical protein [bacterium]